MSKSDDNTNELESYGVWVKNQANGNDEADSTPLDTSDELNLDDGGLDLPDFDDSDFSDMFKDDNSSGADALDDFGSEDDTTLSTDELANITGGVEVEQVEASGEILEDNISFDDVAEPVVDASEDIPSEEPAVDDFSIDEPAAPVSPEDEISLDDFEIDDTAAPAEEASEEISVESSEETTEEGGDEEISLDDFMDGGFSDESVASGNNGYEPGAEPSAETEELSLDDFMDGDSFGDAPAEAQKDETIEDEAPLDMDISFDDSADTVETEENSSIISSDDDYDLDEQEEAPVETEDVSMDDFGSDFGSAESEPVHDSTSENLNAEEVDLSDFGIDTNAEETPIVQDVEEAKNKEKIVDYDLSVGDENTASAPVVNEIKSDAVEAAEPIDNVEHIEEIKPASEGTTVDNSLLQQIVSELSNLKDEMNKLKGNLAELKTSDTAAIAGAAAVAGAAAGAAIASETIEPEVPEATEEAGGFFSDDDGDDTIALSFDELDNIMNTAEFSDTVEASDENADVVEEEPVIEEETAVEEPVVEESVVSEEIELTNEEAPAFEEISSETEVDIEESDATEDTVLDESVIETTQETTEIEPADDVGIEESAIEDTISLDDDNSESFDFEDEKLEEPEIDEFIPDGNDELYENEDLPDEISIPTEDDLLVESTTTDFMDSVKETSDEATDGVDMISESEHDEEDALDLPAELPEGLATAPGVETEIDDDIPTVDKVLEEEAAPEEENFTSVDNFAGEEPVVEETSADYSEVDNLDNSLSDSNIAYLSKEETESEQSVVTADLKQDIKSVLLYMDQLLENLPEDKIVEFAKSDEFVTYKKLFTELGLS